MNTKTKTFVYEGLGFPIELIDAPMKKILDEWVLDINMNELEKFVFNGLIHKPYALTGAEIRFMRKYLELSTTELAQKLGISHATVVKWEGEKSTISPMQEIYLRMFFLDSFQRNALSSLFKEINPEKLISETKEHDFNKPFSINAQNLVIA